MSGRLDGIERRLAALEAYVADDKKGKDKLAALTEDAPVPSEGTIAAASAELGAENPVAPPPDKTPPKTRMAHPQASAMTPPKPKT
jgi:hypothetical protein